MSRKFRIYNRFHFISYTSANIVTRARGRKQDFRLLKYRSSKKYEEVLKKYEEVPKKYEEVQKSAFSPLKWGLVDKGEKGRLQYSGVQVKYVECDSSLLFTVLHLYSIYTSPVIYLYSEYWSLAFPPCLLMIEKTSYFMYTEYNRKIILSLIILNTFV